MTNVAYTQDRRFPDAVILAADSSMLGIIFPNSSEEPSDQQQPPVVSDTPLRMIVHRHDLSAFSIGADVTEMMTQLNKRAFSELRKAWYAERGATSSITEMAMCRSHLRIIGLGPSVV